MKSVNLFMPKILILVLFIFSSLLNAGEIAAYRKREANTSRDQLVMVNSQGEEIVTIDSTDLKDFYIVFNRLVMTDIFSNVKVYDERGLLIFSHQGVRKFEMAQDSMVVLQNNGVAQAYLMREKEAFIQEQEIDFVTTTNNFVLMRSRISRQIMMFSFNQKEKDQIQKSIKSTTQKIDELRLDILALEDLIDGTEEIETLEELNISLAYKKEDYHNTVELLHELELKYERLTSEMIVKNIFPVDLLSKMRRVVKIAASDNFLVLQDYLGDTTILDEYGEIIVNQVRNLEEFYLSDNFLVVIDYNDWVDIYQATDDQNEIIYTGNGLNKIQVTNGFVSFEWGNSVNVLNTNGESETFFLSNIKNYELSNHQILIRSITDSIKVLDQSFQTVFTMPGIRGPIQLRDRSLAYEAEGPWVYFSTYDFQNNYPVSLLGSKSYQFSNEFVAVSLKNSSLLKLYDSRGERIWQDRFVQSIALPTYEDRYRWKIYDLNQ